MRRKDSDSNSDRENENENDSDKYSLYARTLMDGHRQEGTRSTLV
jgi:hypothetical protein